MFPNFPKDFISYIIFGTILLSLLSIILFSLPFLYWWHLRQISRKLSKIIKILEERK